MIEARQALEAVREGRAPDTWLVLRPRRRYYLTQGIGLFVGAIVAGIVASVMALSQAVGPGIVMGLFAALLLFGAGIAFREYHAAKDQMLVLMPDGIVNDTSQVFFFGQTLDYADVAEMTLRVRKSPRGGGVLISIAMSLTDGGQGMIPLDELFDLPSERLAQRIISDHAVYQAAPGARQEC